MLKILKILKILKTKKIKRIAILTSLIIYQNSIAAINNINNLNNPNPPLLKNVAAYVLMDAKTGVVLAQQSMTVRRQPASLTKLMTLYVTFDTLKHRLITLKDPVVVSQEAWHTGGSRMFLPEGQPASVELLIQGMIVDSGNDASVALAEYVGGTEDNFVNMMNHQAGLLNMSQTHFADPTGLPPETVHYSTALDLAHLARALINNFPEYYHYFGEKWMAYNKIKQPNRNGLLWRYPSADGLKTGYTDQSGYCIIGSALQNNTRLIAVILGDTSPTQRVNDAVALFNYGFRYYKTLNIYQAYSPINTVSVLDGVQSKISVGMSSDYFATVTRDAAAKNITFKINLTQPLKAPIQKYQIIGTVDMLLNQKIIATGPAIALSADAKANLFIRIKNRIVNYF